jgi:drug/metabolite transporter (DMT)-like permease
MIDLGSNGRGSAVWLTASASILWGTVFAAADLGLRYTNAYVLVFVRFLLASAVILLIALLFDHRLGIAYQLRRKSTWLLGLIDAVGFLFQYVGQSRTNASDATLLANLAPVLVPLVAWRLSKEGVTKSQMGAMALGFSGLVLMAAPVSKFQAGSLFGELLLFGSSLSYALFIVMSKRVKAVSTGSALAVIVTITVFLAPAAVILGRLNPMDLALGLDVWYSSLYMAIVCTVIPMVLYLRGLRSISSSESGTLLLLEVLSGLILAAALLDQIPTGYELVAGTAIVAALGLRVLFN